MPIETSTVRGYRRVAVIEDYEEIIQRYHCIEHEHAGIRRTYEMICQDYSYFPRAVVAKYLEFCPVCSHRKQHEPITTSTTAPTMTSTSITTSTVSATVLSIAPEIISHPINIDRTRTSANTMSITTLPSQYHKYLDTFMAIGNILFIDMTHRPDEFHSWIGCYIDSWSNYCILFPLRNRSPQEVSRKLSCHIFAIFGFFARKTEIKYRDSYRIVCSVSYIGSDHLGSESLHT